MHELSEKNLIRWWAARRRRYNILVIGIGAGCFLLYQALATKCVDIEITLFTIAFQGVAVGLYVLFANVAYSVAPLVQQKMRPAVPLRFQVLAFRVGVGITVLPFVVVPILVVIRIARGCRD
jgi:hypothetical protein